MKTLKLSVHDIVDLLLRKGDIDSRYFNINAMEEGSRIHDSYQHNQASNYYPEYYLSHTFNLRDYQIIVSGRADGIIVNSNNNVTIDEIKTSSDDLETFYNENSSWHLGQACFYAYIYMLDKDLQQIKVQLTYISQLDTSLIRPYLFFYNRNELEEYIYQFLNQYLDFIEVFQKFRIRRNNSISNLKFPFASYRKYQKELIDYVEQIGKQETIAYIQAKTGTGKTISTLYPFIKDLGKLDYDKIFYLTSKNSIKKVAFDCLCLLLNNGLNIKGISLTSKEKICLNQKKGHCNPDECPYAKKYYDKINRLIIECLKNNDLIDENTIIEYSIKEQICPFEFQLDLSNYVDVIIGDYNYLFESHARLIRFFDDNKIDIPPYLLLIDEAHNLPNRVRDMYSLILEVKKVKVVRELLDGLKRQKGLTSLKDVLDKIILFFENIKNSNSTSNYPNIQKEIKIDDELIDLANEFIEKSKYYFKKNKNILDEFLDLYYDFSFLVKLPFQDNSYSYFYTFDSDNNLLSFSIMCLDSRKLIRQAYTFFKSVIAFSATLTPKNYFIDMLGGDFYSNQLYLPSPFKKENQLVIVNPFINTFYKNRNNSLSYIKEVILQTIQTKMGNYFIYFPSFEYLESFKKYFKYDDDIDCYFQTNNMSELSQKEFLNHFVSNPNKTCLGFLVLGGVFSEGIDLVSDRLIGAIVVSVGLPKVSFINQELLNYYSSYDEENAFKYTYTYPGINKVFQASGRVIRDENDKGVIILLDTRYRHLDYLSILNETYENIVTLNYPQELVKILKRFWKDE